MVTLLEPSEGHRQGAINCIGRPLIGMETRVVRASSEEQVRPDEEVPAGEVGELIIRGPKLMQGYWNRPEQTATRLRHGWLYTGDLVYYDDDGYYYILDRLDDAISVGGDEGLPERGRAGAGAASPDQAECRDRDAGRPLGPVGQGVRGAGGAALGARRE